MNARATPLGSFGVVISRLDKHKMRGTLNTTRGCRQGKYDEADRMYVRAIEAGERLLGPDHPKVATRVGTRAVLLHQQVRREHCHRLVVGMATLQVAE